MCEIKQWIVEDLWNPDLKMGSFLLFNLYQNKSHVSPLGKEVWEIVTIFCVQRKIKKFDKHIVSSHITYKSIKFNNGNF